MAEGTSNIRPVSAVYVDPVSALESSLTASRTHSNPNVVNGDKDMKATKSPSEQIGRYQAWLRFLKLQILGQITWFKSPTERRKVAIYKDRRIALLHFVLHIPPLAAAIALLALNGNRYFVGTSFSRSTALQFAAKLHEVLMQTSIAEILFSTVRSQVTRGYIPLGVMLAPVYASQLHYL